MHFKTLLHSIREMNNVWLTGCIQFYNVVSFRYQLFFIPQNTKYQLLNIPTSPWQSWLWYVSISFLHLQGPDGPIHLNEFMPTDLETYCKNMSTEGEWADHIAVLATANVLEKDILVITSSPSSSPDDVMTWIVGKEGFSGDPLLLGHIYENHYVSLQPKGNVAI